MAVPVISILNEKGGTGKTTLSINLATAFAEAGHKVALVDSDPQGSAFSWHSIAVNPKFDLIHVADNKELEAVGEHLDGHTLVIIDGCPAANPIQATAIKFADLILIPIRPSGLDFWAASDLIKLVQSAMAKNSDLKAFFVPSAVVRRSTMNRSLQSALFKSEIDSLPVGTSQLQDYAKTITEGLTALDKPNSKAAHEIRAIFNNIKEILGV